MSFDRIRTPNVIERPKDAQMTTSDSRRARAIPVFDAVRSRNRDLLREELASGGDPNAPDREGLTPMMEAVLTGQPDMVSVLLDQGADVNAQDREGWTALHFAAQDYQVDIAKQLLDRGARIDAVDSHGNSALWRAVFNAAGRDAMIKLLLARGADRSLENKHGISPATLAADNKATQELFSR